MLNALPVFPDEGVVAVLESEGLEEVDPLVSLVAAELKFAKKLGIFSLPGMLSGALFPKLNEEAGELNEGTPRPGFEVVSEVFSAGVTVKIGNLGCSGRLNDFSGCGSVTFADFAASLSVGCAVVSEEEPPAGLADNELNRLLGLKNAEASDLKVEDDFDKSAGAEKLLAIEGAAPGVCVSKVTDFLEDFARSSLSVFFRSLTIASASRSCFSHLEYDFEERRVGVTVGGAGGLNATFPVETRLE